MMSAIRVLFVSLYTLSIGYRLPHLDLRRSSVMRSFAKSVLRYVSVHVAVDVILSATYQRVPIGANSLQ